MNDLFITCIPNNSVQIEELCYGQKIWTFLTWSSGEICAFRQGTE